MDTIEIHRLVYFSTFNSGRIDSAPSALRDILAASRRNNARDAITGYLIFDGEIFLQILEGPKPAVEATVLRIESDKRHRKMTVLGFVPSADRLFPSWSMEAYLRSPSHQEVFARHGFAGKIEPGALTANRIVSLATELSILGIR